MSEGQCARALRIIVAAVLLVVGLAGCGRRGGLEPPPDASVAGSGSVTPPDPSLAGSSGASAPDDEAASFRRPKRVPITPPKQPFILDPLL